MILLTCPRHADARNRSEPHRRHRGGATAERSSRFTASVLSRNSAPSAAPAWGGWIRGFGLQQADADLPVVLVDPLDHVPVELEPPMTTAGKSIPPARNWSSVTGCWPALRSRSSSRNCWVSASAINRIPPHPPQGESKGLVIDGRRSTLVGGRGGGPLRCRYSLLSAADRQAAMAALEITDVRLIGGWEETGASRLCRAARGASRLPDQQRSRPAGTVCRVDVAVGEGKVITCRRVPNWCGCSIVSVWWLSSRSVRSWPCWRSRARSMLLPRTSAALRSAAIRASVAGYR